MSRETEQLFREIHKHLEQFENSPGAYRPNTVGEILQFLDEAEVLITSSQGGMLWLEREIKKMK